MNKLNQYFTEIAYSVQEFPKFCQKLDKFLPKSWEVLTTSQKKSSDYQYKAAVFVNHDTKEIIFANAGTKITHFWDMWDNAKLFFGYVPTKLPSIKSLITDAIETLQDIGKDLKDYTIKTTGHSAGSISSVLAAIELQSRGYKVKSSTTFDSPGSGDVLDQAIKQELFSSAQLQIDDIEFETYIITPNLINTNSNHIVAPKIILKEPKPESVVVEDNTNQGGFFSSFTSKISKTIKSATKFLGIDKIINKVKNTLNNHGLENFHDEISSIKIKEFDRVYRKKHVLEYNKKIAELAQNVPTTGEEKFCMIKKGEYGEEIPIMMSLQTLNRLSYQLYKDSQIISSETPNFTSVSNCHESEQTKQPKFNVNNISDNNFIQDNKHVYQEYGSASTVSAMGVIGVEYESISCYA